ncbi:MAG: hypothetical protein Ta2F_03810 [Termitinemataceae bacterium]|nr:MAG: hypothetical protein Ta2F_03810 [Termitinemataceae bacterium]
MFERKNKRLTSHASAYIENVTAGDAFLKNISITGCKLEHTARIDGIVGETYKITIKPEAASNTGFFDVVAELRWINIDNCAYEAGFQIIESPQGKFFERYVDYLAYRNIALN